MDDGAMTWEAKTKFKNSIFKSFIEFTRENIIISASACIENNTVGSHFRTKIKLHDMQYINDMQYIKRLLLHVSVVKNIPWKAISEIKKKQICFRDTFAGQTKK